MLRQGLFALREALYNIRRSKFMSAVVISTMVVALGVLGLLSLLIADLNAISEQMGARLQIVAFLNQDASLEQVADEIQKIEGVAEVNKVTREEAKQSMSEELGSDLKALLSDANPFPDAVEVTVTQAERMPALIPKIQEIAGVEDVQGNAELAEQLNNIEGAVQLLGLLITGALVIATLAIVVNTIQLAVHARRREIEIMRLVGAPNWFIRLPFLCEGVIFGVFSGIITTVGISAWRLFPLTQLRRWFSFIPIQQGANGLGTAIILVVVVGFLMGLIGSTLSVHRYLRFEKSLAPQE
jgi:cell division transport system permease protein